MPNKTQTAATTTAKASKIHDPMLTLQRAVGDVPPTRWRGRRVVSYICL